MFEKVLNSSMLWKAQQAKAVEFSLVDLRNFGIGARKTVDDTPYGGGDGMLLMVDPLVRAITYAKEQDSTAKVYLPTPRGVVYKQSKAKAIAAADEGVIIVCPRYEGYDERVTHWVDEQFCIGKYILTGGEIPAMVLLDSVVRLLPGVLGGEESTLYESFQEDDTSIEYAQYTRPEVYKDLVVPSVLVSGNHAQIAAWRKKSSEEAQKNES